MRVSRLITNRRLFILLASLILLIVVAGLTLRGRDRAASWPEKLVVDIQNTVGGWIYRPVSKLTAFLDGIHNLHDMYVENAQLKAEMQNYSALKAQLQDAESENKRLSAMLGFKQSHDGQMKLLPAHVIGRSPTQWSDELTVDAGTSEGVHNNMAVISADGSLVGRVAEAFQHSSKVILITDTQVGDGVSACVQNGTSQPPFGIVVGSSSESGMLEMSFLSPVAQVAEGQMVVTSPFSDIFPKGLVIGKVVKVTAGLQGLTQSALIQPAADLDYLQEVFIVQQATGVQK
jgi:rod shape-determining protein MreC